MVFCCAVCCSNWDKQRKDGVSFHRFPKDDALRRRLVHALRLKSMLANYEKTGFVCSDHFLPEDLNRDLKAELLGCESRKRLNSDALRSVFSLLPEPAARTERCSGAT